MLMQTRSISDHALLFRCGFLALPTVTAAGIINQRPDVMRLALFCGVSERTAQRWLKDGLPTRTRLSLEMLTNGDYLPDKWRRAGVKIEHDGLYLRSGHSVSLDAVTHWPFIMHAVNWSKVPFIRAQRTYD